MQVTTKSGFECEIDPRVFADYRTISLIVAMFKGKNDSNNIVGSVELVNRILSPEDQEKLFAALEDETGFVDPAAVYDTILEIQEIVRRGDETTKK